MSKRTRSLFTMIMVVVFTFSMMFVLQGCGGAGTTETTAAGETTAAPAETTAAAAEPGEVVIYNFKAQFPTEQGENQWFAQYTTDDGATFLDMENVGRWESPFVEEGETSFEGSMIEGGNTFRPGKHDPVIKWVAPGAGAITIKGFLTKRMVDASVTAEGVPAADGCTLKILQNTTELWKVDVAADDLSFHSLTKDIAPISVAAEDAIYLVLLGDDGFDETAFSYEINFQPNGTPESIAAAPTPVPPTSSLLYGAETSTTPKVYDGYWSEFIVDGILAAAGGGTLCSGGAVTTEPFIIDVAPAAPITVSSVKVFNVPTNINADYKVYLEVGGAWQEIDHQVNSTVAVTEKVLDAPVENVTKVRVEILVPGPDTYAYLDEIEAY